MKMPSVYEPGKYETGIYKRWESSHLFEADPASPKEHFSISMPPPNETATLHIGSALFVTLQDILARQARQQGKDVLWLPGTDHAAIATDNLVEKQLTEQGVSKHEIGRDEFLKRVKEFVDNNRGKILAQLRAMGASCDWSRLRYTLDDTLSRCVNEVFVKMYNDGLIYRGNRIVNWDPKLETTVSDDEVEHREEKAPFYTLKYGPFEIATARPETKFGDKYVVMHPDDKRYSQYKHGDSFEADWINGPVKATVIKDEAIDPAFGTGVMTITPWHDATDFEIAERHGLEKDQIIGFDGKLLPIAGEFAGLTIDEARPKIIEKLKANNLLVKKEEYTHNLAANSRGGGVIEPQVMLQWFVDVNRPAVDWKGQQRSLKEVMRAVVEDGDTQVIPKHFERVYYHWIDNLRDWCISRQIWWGHRVPVWYKDEEVYAGVRPPEDFDPAQPKGQGWQQDPDTLDTWFSSALWTWSTLLDPELAGDYSLSLGDLLERSQDFKVYHPTSVMETGWDILFFWVARMILATTYVTGQIPFKKVYLHGLVRTETGKKMSKSDPSTIVDPMEVIPKYGTDALRLALVAGVGASGDQRLGIKRVEDNRNFCNKLWNVARYVSTVLEEANATGSYPIAKVGAKTPADHWILDKSSILTGAVSKDLAKFRFGEAYQKLYHFIWDDLADWYIEASKSESNPALLKSVLETTLISLHPFAPFITETIWQNLGHKDLLAAQLRPQISAADKEQAAKFDELKEIITVIRRWSVLIGSKKFGFHVSPLVKENSNLIRKMAGKITLAEQAKEMGGLRLPIQGHEVYIDSTKEQGRMYLEKTENEKKAVEASIKQLESRLASSSYTKNAPKELVRETQQQLEQHQSKLGLLNNELRMVSDWLDG